MRCYKCGQTIEDNASFCRFCGTSQGSGATTVLDEANNPFAMPEEIHMDPPTEVIPETQTNPEPVFAAAPAWQTYQPEPAPVYQSAPAPVYQPDPAPAYQPAYQPQYNSAPVYSDNTGNRPMIQLPTNRGLAKMFFLPMLTFGIYGMVIWSRIVSELNIVASRYDGKRTMPYFGMNMLAGLTLGIYPLVWIHGFCNRIGDELRRRNIPYSFDASTFWLWNVLGSLIVVGPFIYLHKLMKSMNLLNADFNEHG